MLVNWKSEINNDKNIIIIIIICKLKRRLLRCIKNYCHKCHLQLQTDVLLMSEIVVFKQLIMII